MSTISESDRPIINTLFPEPLYYGQFERTEEIDKRIYERMMSTDISLRPNFDPRPAETRHTVFPVIPPVNSGTNSSTEPIRKFLEYDVTKSFSPIQAKGPVDGYLRHVNTESSLRNQYFGIQHGAIQSTYIPSSTSDLYRVSVPTSSLSNEEQPFPLLFQKDTYITRGNEAIQQSRIGKEIFNNATKQQLRGIN